MVAFEINLLSIIVFFLGPIRFNITIIVNFVTIIEIITKENAFAKWPASVQLY